MTQPELFWSSCFLQYTYVNSTFFNNAKQKICSLKFSLFPPLQISVDSNSGSLWRVISERAHWFGGLGEGHVWTHRREREREGKYRSMYVWRQTWKFFVAQAPLQNIHPFPPLVLKVLSRPNASELFCVRINNNSYDLINVPKGRKCGS